MTDREVRVRVAIAVLIVTLAVVFAIFVLDWDAWWKAHF